MKKLLALAAALLASFTLLSLAFAQKPAAPAGRTVVMAKDAPPPIGPYSQAIKAGEFVFCAGQTARDPVTNKLIEGDVSAQTDRVLKNISAVLAAAGTDMSHVVKTTVYLRSEERRVGKECR